RCAPPHDVQQHAQTAAVRHPLELTNEIREGAGEHSHRLTGLQLRLPAQYVVCIACIDESFDNPRRRRRRTFALRDQSDDAQGAVDAAPAIPCRIELNKQIARKKRYLHVIHAPRVAAELLAERQEDEKALVGKVTRSNALAMRLTLHRIPAAQIECPTGMRAPRRVAKLDSGSGTLEHVLTHSSTTLSRTRPIAHGPGTEQKLQNASSLDDFATPLHLV